MKIEMGPCRKFKMTDDEGNDLTRAVPVRVITIETEVNQPTRAIMEVALVEEVRVVPDIVNYYAGGFGKIKGLILADGSLHYFPGEKNGR